MAENGVYATMCGRKAAPRVGVAVFCCGDGKSPMCVLDIRFVGKPLRRVRASLGEPL